MSAKAEAYAERLAAYRRVTGRTDPVLWCSCPVAHAEPRDGHNPVPA